MIRPELGYGRGRIGPHRNTTMNAFRLVLTAVFLVSGICFVMTCFYSHNQALPVANAVVFGASMIALATLARDEVRQTQ